MLKPVQTFLLALLGVFAPIKAAVAVVCILVIADLILGILAARKRGETITSAGLRRSVSKLFIYETALALGFLTEIALTGDSFPVSKIVSAIIGLTELTSCIENLNEISGTDLLKALLSKLGSKS
jgi:formate hydrogenlyase subunit 4